MLMALLRASSHILLKSERSHMVAIAKRVCVSVHVRLLACVNVGQHAVHCVDVGVFNLDLPTPRFFHVN